MRGRVTLRVRCSATGPGDSIGAETVVLMYPVKAPSGSGVLSGSNGLLCRTAPGRPSGKGHGGRRSPLRPIALAGVLALPVALLSATSVPVAHAAAQPVQGGTPVYVTDTAGSRVVKVEPGGTVTSIPVTPNCPAGTPPERTKMDPGKVAVDAAGNIYVANYYAYNVMKITPAGSSTIIAGDRDCDPTTPTGDLQSPNGIAVDATGTVYVLDDNRHSVWKIDIGGTVSKIADVPDAAGAVLDGKGSLYTISSNSLVKVSLADGTSQVVTQFTPNPSDPLDRPVGLAMGPDGSFYAPFYHDNRVIKVKGGQQSTITTKSNPISVAVDNTGSLYVGYEGYVVMKAPAGCTTVDCEVDINSGTIYARGIAVPPSPNAPTNVHALAEPTRAIVSFSPSDSPSVTGYTVTATPTRGTGAAVTGHGSSSPITVTGLRPGTTYDISVTATNAAGGSSSPARAAKATNGIWDSIVAFLKKFVLFRPAAWSAR